MAAKKWTAFAADASDFSYEGASLKKNWARLHVGDQEPYPDVKKISALMADDASLKKIKKGDAAAVAAELEQAWRSFHAGEFQDAFKRGDALGAFGAVVAAKAVGIYASSVSEDEVEKKTLLQEAAERCEAAALLLPDDANLHYFHAFTLGRYSQCISITKALAQGLGGKIKASLKTALELSPKHAEAHLAMAMYHAEIINKIGGMIGKLTYGASADEAVKLLEGARKLAPKSPVVYLESGRGLQLLYGKKKAAESSAFFEQASALKPFDAMEYLDQQAAADALE
jgi:tetratricopeptide (TPR) repeat protein